MSNCYAMTCKRKIILGRFGSRSCVPHLAVVILHKLMMFVTFRRWPYLWTYTLMGMMYRREDRKESYGLPTHH